MRKLVITLFIGGGICISLADPIAISITEFSTDTIFYDSSYAELPRIELFYTTISENNVVLSLDSIVTTHGKYEPYRYYLDPNIYNVVRVFGNVLGRISDTLRVYATFAGGTVADTVYWPAEEINGQGVPAPPTGTSVARIPYWSWWYIDYTPTFGKENDDWGIITGKILDTNHQPIPLISHPHIIAQGSYGRIVEKWIREGGTYYLALGTGKYSVSATADGYRTQVYPESVVVMDRDTTENIDFFLEPMGITEAKEIKPQYFSLSTSLFRDKIKIYFEIPKSSRIRLGIFDKLGRKVLSLLNKKMEAGSHTTHWDRRDKNGKRVPQGLYFITLETETFSITKKLVLMN